MSIKIKIIVWATVVILVSVINILAMRYCNEVTTTKDNETHILLTTQNDQLRAVYLRPSGFDIHQSIDVYCKTCNHTLFANHYKYGDLSIANGEIVCIYQSPFMRAYEYTFSPTNTHFIFWISNTHSYCAGEQYGLSDLFERVRQSDSRIRNEFYPFTNYMIGSRKWDWYEGFIEFPIAYGNHEAITLVRRYANGNFSREELSINSRSKLTKEDIIEYSAKLLKKYKIGGSYRKNRDR